MNKFEFYQRIKLLSNGALEASSITGANDGTITRPGSEKAFYESIKLDENGALKVYVIGTTPAPPVLTSSLLLENNFFFLLETGDELLLN
jgi:hypothetical protein